MLKRACIAIVDAAHCRIYSYQHDDDQPPSMNELRDLVSPGRQAHGMFTDQPSRAPGGNGHHGTKDDHRSDHVDELDRRFAKVVSSEIERVLGDHKMRHVILIASPKMLAKLRAEDSAFRRDGVSLDEIAQDLAWLTSPQVHDHLAAMNLIEPRARIPFARAARSR